MSSPEFYFAPEGGAPGPEPKEQEPVPYYRAAKFERERHAKRAYFKCQETVLRAHSEADLSTYRLLLDQVSHVIVLGEPPPEELDRRLQRILSRGEATTLPADVLHLLQERRTQASQLGPWVERHFRPGQPL